VKLPPINSIVGIVWEDSGLVSFRGGTPPANLRLGAFRAFGRVMRVDKKAGELVIAHEESVAPNTFNAASSPDYDTYTVVAINSIREVWVLSQTGQKRKK